MAKPLKYRAGKSGTPTLRCADGVHRSQTRIVSAATDSRTEPQLIRSCRGLRPLCSLAPRHATDAHTIPRLATLDATMLESIRVAYGSGRHCPTFIGPRGRLSWTSGFSRDTGRGARCRRTDASRPLTENFGGPVHFDVEQREGARENSRKSRALTEVLPDRTSVRVRRVARWPANSAPAFRVGKRAGRSRLQQVTSGILLTFSPPCWLRRLAPFAVPKTPHLLEKGRDVE